MRYKEEMRRPEELALPKTEEVEISEKEMEITLNLIEQLTAPFDHGKYKDTYTKELETLIKAKIEGKEVVKGKEPEATRIPDLMAKLEQSLKEARERRKS